MPVVVALLLILAVHAGTNLAAWSRVGLLADDRFAVGMPIWFDLQHTPWAERLHSVFFPAVQADAAAALYRPLVALLFLIEYPLFGVEACYYHAVNSVFHCTTALVWFVLVRRWTSSPAAGLAVALTFVGWVGHSEATHWVSARVNLQAMCFLSLSLLVWDNAERAGSGPGRSRWNWARQGASLGLGLLALGAKESAILILPMAFLVSWLRAEEVGGVLARLRRSVFRVVPVLLLVLAFAVLRRGVLHTWGAGARSAWHLDVASPAAWATAWPSHRWPARPALPVRLAASVSVAVASESPAAVALRFTPLPILLRCQIGDLVGNCLRRLRAGQAAHGAAH